jgi:hypothetical protein
MYFRHDTFREEVELMPEHVDLAFEMFKDVERGLNDSKGFLVTRYIKSDQNPRQDPQLLVIESNKNWGNSFAAAKFIQKVLDRIEAHDTVVSLPFSSMTLDHPEMGASGGFHNINSRKIVSELVEDRRAEAARKMAIEMANEAPTPGGPG